MSAAEPDYIAVGCTFDTVVANLMPFYLGAARGDETVAARTILVLLKAYNPATPPEIELAGRILGFSAAAADNLRLSMRSGLPDNKVLRYRTNAAALDRSADKCRAVLAEMQARREEMEQQEAVPVPRQDARTPGVSGRFPAFADMESELAAMRHAVAQAKASASPSGPAGG